MGYKDVINDIANDFYGDRIIEMMEENKDIKEQFLKWPKPVQEKFIKNMIDIMSEDSFDTLFGEGSEFYKKIQPILDRE